MVNLSLMTKMMMKLTRKKRTKMERVCSKQTSVVPYLATTQHANQARINNFGYK